MGKAIGIDLGTTNTAVAVMVDGRPRVLEDEKGYKVLPSCVSIKEDGRFVVGQAAHSLVITQQKTTVYAVKRLMGRHFDSPEVEELRRRVGFTIEPDEDGFARVVLGDQAYSPIELSALILQVARQTAERVLDEDIDEAVITVPAYFNHAQRSATLEAARLAGLRCDRLLNEPTAAALAYGFRKDIDRTLVIFDLGGGTFDVSVLHMSRGVYEILATAGDTALGGEDFDFRLVDYLADDFQARNGLDPRQDPVALQRLKDAAESAKKELSFTDRTTVFIPRITESHNLETAVSRLTLESLVQDLVDRAVDVARGAVQDAGLQISDIEEVILVGGQTRMPRVREAISALFNREPSRSVHPEEVVAIGAAVHANSLVDPAAHQPVLLDVTPFDLGIDVAGGLFQPLITRNSAVPASSTRVFATNRDNQDSVQVVVRQGSSRFAAENESLGAFVMSGLTPSPRMQTKVEVTFRIDTNGMLHCSAVEPETGERREITVRNYAQLAKGGGKLPPDLAGDVGALPPAASDDSAVSSTSQSDAPKTRSRGGIFGRLMGGRRRGAPKAAAAAPPVDSAPSSSAPPPEAPALDLDRRYTGPLSPIPSGGGAPAPLDEAPPLAEDEPLALPADAAEDYDEELLPLPDEDSAFDEPSSSMGDEDDDLIALPDDALEAHDSLALPDEDDLEESADSDPQWTEPSDIDLQQGVPLAAPPDDEDLSSALADAFDFEDVDEPSEGVLLEEPPAQSVDELDELDELDDLDDVLAEAMALAEASLDALPTEEHDSIPPVPTPVVPTEEDDADPDSEDTDIFRIRKPAPPPPPPPAGRRRKPARLKLAYRKVPSMVTEYRENLRRGGCFVHTERPLAVGRECLIEVRAPGLGSPIMINGVVTWSSASHASLVEGQPPGMSIEYRLTEPQRGEIEDTLARLLG